MKLEDCKPGTRVAVYDSGSRITATVNYADSGLVYVAYDSDQTATFYPHFAQQLRRLRVKKREEKWTLAEIHKAWVATSDLRIWTTTNGNGLCENLLAIAAEKGKK